MIFSRGRARNNGQELRLPAKPSRRSAPSVGEPLDMSWGQLAAVMSGNMGQYSGLITHERAYRESPWVGPMLHASASACAARPFRLYRENAKGKARLADHWLLDLMGRPNPEAGISEYTLKYRTFFLYDYDGEVLWHLGRDDRTSPTEAPDFITIFRRREAVPVLDHALGEFIGWHLTIDGVPYFADRNDVIHFHHFDPITHRSSFNPFTKRRLEPNRGRSPLDAKRLAISSDIAAARYNYDFFSRGIASNVAIIDKASTIPLGEEQEFKEK